MVLESRNRQVIRNTRVRKHPGDKANFLKWSLHEEMTTAEIENLHNTKHTTIVVTSSYFCFDSDI